MEIKFKYLVLSVLIPLCAMAGKQENDELLTINTNGLSVVSALPTSHKDNSLSTQSPTSPQYAWHPLCSWYEHKEKTSPKSATIVLVKTQKFSVFSLQTQPEIYHFKEARHLWCLRGESGRNMARASFYHFFEQDNSKRVSIAKHLFQLGNLTDQKFAIDYLKAVHRDKTHEHYLELDKFLALDTHFKDKFDNII